ncbi:MAG: hypothetical protein ACYC0Q_00125 [Eubacteriales bacterium]
MKRPIPEKGNAFVREKTGSATMINLDGKWEHDFVDDDTPAGDKPGHELSHEKKHEQE